ncbi:hypothetical protein SAMN05192562_101365 [Kosakonia arachidis]|uniref:Uncharacterized protein n=1 Tax=Kosakonia arachidis TaxID=551989 RepID=A0A1I6Y6H5_9ENTR|nr:hypothetical protein SAMN05192562_101365 [Kosakonia arachidis]
MQSPQIHLITSCAKGKNLLIPDSPARDIHEGTSPESAFRRWLEQTPPIRNYIALPAISLYRGAHGSIATEIPRSTQHLDLSVISVGMGFLHSSQSVTEVNDEHR